MGHVRRPGMTLLALALLLGTMAAFTYTETLKLERKPVGEARFDRWLSPVCDCPHETARLRFELREPERIDVRMVNEEGEIVRLLGSGLRQPAGTISLTWDGRDETGQVVPDGPYRVRVRLRDERRTIAIPVDVNVDTKAPRVRLRSISPSVLDPGDDLSVRYRANEVGTPILVVEGEDVLRGARRQAGVRAVTWPRLAEELGLAPGIYSVALAVEDRAGNVSEATETAGILVRAPSPPR